MNRFETTLVPGRKVPYTTWTFVEIPPHVAAAWARGGPYAVRGRIDGVPFRGTVSRGEGVVRMSVTRAWLEEAGLSLGDSVKVEIELDPEPRPVDVPEELQAVFDGDAGLADLFEALPPAHRRAWATYIGEAKRPETRARRAARAPEGIRNRAFPR